MGSTKMMLYMMPLVSVWIGFIMPAGIGVYWIAQSVTGMAQDYFLTKHYRKVYDAEDAEKARLEAEEKAREELRQAERERRQALGLNAVNPNTSKKKLATQGKKPAKPPQKPLDKMTPKELREYAEELERKMQSGNRQEPSGVVGDRPFARGRNYDPQRYGGDEEGTQDSQEDAAQEMEVFEPEPETEQYELEDTTDSGDK